MEDNMNVFENEVLDTQVNPEAETVENTDEGDGLGKAIAIGIAVVGVGFLINGIKNVIKKRAEKKDDKPEKKTHCQVIFQSPIRVVKTEIVDSENKRTDSKE